MRCGCRYASGDSKNRGGGRPGDPFGREALSFSREKLMQRNVELRVTDMDKNGVALGFLFFGTGANRRNFAEDIVKVRCTQGGGGGRLNVRSCVAVLSCVRDTICAIVFARVRDFRLLARSRY